MAKGETSTATSTNPLRLLLFVLGVFFLIAGVAYFMLAYQTANTPPQFLSRADEIVSGVPWCLAMGYLGLIAGVGLIGIRRYGQTAAAVFLMATVLLYIVRMKSAAGARRVELPMSEGSASFAIAIFIGILVLLFLPPTIRLIADSEDGPEDAGGEDPPARPQRRWVGSRASVIAVTVLALAATAFVYAKAEPRRFIGFNAIEFDRFFTGERYGLKLEYYVKADIGQTVRFYVDTGSGETNTIPVQAGLSKKEEPVIRFTGIWGLYGNAESKLFPDSEEEHAKRILVKVGGRYPLKPDKPVMIYDYIDEDGTARKVYARLVERTPEDPD